jgi:hypothetical protein
MGSKKVTIGYKYYMGIHMGVCRGPVNGISKITVGGKTAWQGNWTASGAFSIHQSGLFGGEKKRAASTVRCTACSARAPSSHRRRWSRR